MSDPKPAPPPSNLVRLWMPLYPGDYLRDTIGLNNAQHGAYLRSIMAYWVKGESLTADELREICGREINRIHRFFVFEGGRYHHKRIDYELERAREQRLKSRIKALKGVQARLKKDSTPP
jgi:uncharacterized protein YdaU (DUF1376 family)